MNDDKKSGAKGPKGKTEADPGPLSEQASEQIRGRRFELSEAIGRENADMLKGASPVARSRQVLFEIEQFLEDRLYDPDGSLLRTLLARLQDDPTLPARHFERPLGALAELIASFLGGTPAADQALALLVRDTDARWGREYQERPRFELNGAPPSPDDPYTVAQVRSALDDLQRALAG